MQQSPAQGPLAPYVPHGGSVWLFAFVGDPLFVCVVCCWRTKRCGDDAQGHHRGIRLSLIHI